MIDEQTEAVLARLSEHFNSRVRSVASYGAHFEALWSALSTSTRGGKMLRPALVLAAHRALGAPRPGAVVDVAAAFELLHTAFLIHDDVIDRDLTRRGAPNIGGVFRIRALDHGADDNAAHDWADAAALLAGDLVLSHAQRFIALADLDPRTRRALLDLFDTAITASAAGELADVTNSLRLPDATLEHVIATEADKTAVYSFQAPLQAGALLADAPPALVEQLSRIGRELGIAFQLTDDLLGVFGDESDTGKSTTSDLREGKTTPLILHARTTTAWPLIAPLIGKRDLTDREADAARRRLEEAGSRDFVERLAQQHGARARTLLEDGLVPTDLADALMPLATRSLERTR